MHFSLLVLLVSTYVLIFMNDDEIILQSRSFSSYNEINEMLSDSDEPWLNESMVEFNCDDYLRSTESLLKLLNIICGLDQVKLIAAKYKDCFDNLYAFFVEQSLLEFEKLEIEHKEKEDMLLEKRKEFDYIAIKYEKSHYTLRKVHSLLKTSQVFSKELPSKGSDTSKINIFKQEVKFIFAFVEEKENKLIDLVNFIFNTFKKNSIKHLYFEKIKHHLENHFEKLYGDVISEQIKSTENLQDEIDDLYEKYQHIHDSCEFLQNRYIDNIGCLNKLLPKVDKLDIFTTSFSELKLS